MSPALHCSEVACCLTLSTTLLMPPLFPSPHLQVHSHLFSVKSSFSECRLVEFGVQTPSSDESPGAAEGPFTRSLPPPPPFPRWAPFALVQ